MNSSALSDDGRKLWIGDRRIANYQGGSAHWTMALDLECLVDVIDLSAG